MKTVTIEFSDEAFDLLHKVAIIKDKDIHDLIKDKFDWYEKYWNDPEKVKKHLEYVEKSELEKEETKILKTHPLQQYILKKYKNGNKRILAWRTCPIHEAKKFDSNPDIDGFNNHIGEYWYQIRTVHSPKGLPWNVVDKSITRYKKSLKALKRAINAELGWKHYNVK
jgi:hypothetical protein